MQKRNFGNYEYFIGQMKFIVTTWAYGETYWYAQISLSSSQGSDYHRIYTSDTPYATENDARYVAEKLLAESLAGLMKDHIDNRIDGCTGSRKDGTPSANVNF